MTLEELDRLFEDPANRPFGVFYRCSTDPRVIAPSRPGWRGWQINWAHPRALPFSLLYLATLLGPLVLVATFGPSDVVRLSILAGVAFAISVAFLIGLSARLSRRHPPRSGDAGRDR